MDIGKKQEERVAEPIVNPVPQEQPVPAPEPEPIGVPTPLVPVGDPSDELVDWTHDVIEREYPKLPDGAA